MKKHTLYYIALSALAMLTGCSNEENFGLKPTDGNRSLTATIEQNDLSRTAVSEEGQVTWTETDAIGVRCIRHRFPKHPVHLSIEHR